MISVIVATYQRRLLLARAIESVFNQTYGDREVIVVDDGSTDGTAESLSGTPVTYVRITHSGNPALARNHGLARARGDLIAFLDSDDTWQPTALAELSEALARHPRAGFSYCDYDPSPQPMPALPLVGDIFDALLETDFLVTGGVLIRRAAVQTIGGYDPTCCPAEDWDYWLRLAAFFPGAAVPRRLITIGTRDDSLSRAPGGAIHRANLRVLRKALRWCRMHRPASVGLARQSLRRTLVSSARYHWHQHAIARSMRDLAFAPLGR